MTMTTDNETADDAFTIMAGDRELVLHYDVAAVFEACDALHLKMEDAATALRGENVTPEILRVFFWAGLRAYHQNVTLREATNLMFQCNAGFAPIMYAALIRGVEQISTSPLATSMGALGATAEAH
jgi:hypothetical protein